MRAPVIPSPTKLIVVASAQEFERRRVFRAAYDGARSEMACGDLFGADFPACEPEAGAARSRGRARTRLRACGFRTPKGSRSFGNIEESG